MSDYIEVQAHERNGNTVKEHVRRKDGKSMTEQDWETYYEERAGDFLQSVAKDESGSGGQIVGAVEKVLKSRDSESYNNRKQVEDFLRYEKTREDAKLVVNLKGASRRDIEERLDGIGRNTPVMVKFKDGSVLFANTGTQYAKDYYPSTPEESRTYSPAFCDGGEMRFENEGISPVDIDEVEEVSVFRGYPRRPEPSEGDLPERGGYAQRDGFYLYTPDVESASPTTRSILSGGLGG